MKSSFCSCMQYSYNYYMYDTLGIHIAECKYFKLFYIYNILGTTMLSAVLFLAGTCLIGHVYGNSASIKVADIWDGRYHLRLTVTATTDLRGWEVLLKFSSTVTVVDVSKIHPLVLCCKSVHSLLHRFSVLFIYRFCIVYVL